MISAEEYVDQLEKQLEAVEAERDALKAQVANWTDAAAQFSHNSDFYQGIVCQIGEVFGEEARTSDDGSVQDDVLALKVPELVTALSVQLQELVEWADCYIGTTGLYEAVENARKAPTSLARLKAEWQAEALEWLPIESAPKDGTRVLLKGKNEKIADGVFGQPNGWANPKTWIWPYVMAEPTHWFPLRSQAEKDA